MLENSVKKYNFFYKYVAEVSSVEMISTSSSFPTLNIQHLKLKYIFFFWYLVLNSNNSKKIKYKENIRAITRIDSHSQLTCDMLVVFHSQGQPYHQSLR